MCPPACAWKNAIRSENLWFGLLVFGAVLGFFAFFAFELVAQPLNVRNKGRQGLSDRIV